MAAPRVDDEARRTHLRERVDADVVYLFEDNGLSLDLQYQISLHYPTMRKFAALAENRADARVALAADFALDVAAGGAAVRAQLAAATSCWEIAREYADKEKVVRAEARSLGTPRPMASNDRAAMKRALEGTYYSLEEKEEPSATYLAAKLEELEEGEFNASHLDEISSKEDDVELSVQSAVDSQGRIRITREKRKARLPGTTEELRTKLKIEAHMLIMLQENFWQKAWFAGFTMQDMYLHLEWLLGEKVYSLKIPKGDNSATMAPLHPNWQIFLQYEFQVRKIGVQEGSGCGETHP